MSESEKIIISSSESKKHDSNDVYDIKIKSKKKNNALKKNNAFDDCPFFLREFLLYLLTILGRSKNTVDGYYIDLRTFLRFVNTYYNGFGFEDFNKITIKNVSLEMLEKLTISDIYEYMHFLMDTLENSAITRSRKISSLKTFFKYLTTKVNLLTNNPVKELEVPSVKHTLPKHLSLEESIDLLENVSGDYCERDFCILTLFLNCGMRLSELVGINFSDLDLIDKSLKLLGKGNKERVIYINDACVETLKKYITVRAGKDKKKEVFEKNALFISKNGHRISKRRIQQIVEENLKKSGLSGYSTHKLRHTAATLLYQYGSVDIRILKELLGHSNLSTTEIYTHVSNEQLKQASLKSPLNKPIQNKK